jgi:uncharacterized protein DUF4956
VRQWLDAVGSAAGGGRPALAPWQFLVLLGVSLLAAFLLTALYSRFYLGRGTGSNLHRAFPLLAVAITAIFVCIQFSLPLSLGLLGALSIVRFRTPVKEPEEIGFLMVVIATSLAAATGMLVFLGLLLVATVTALLVQQGARGLFRRRGESGLVVASLAQAAYDAAAPTLLAELASVGRGGGLESLTVQDGRVTLTWRFHGLAGGRAAELERRLRQCAATDSLAIVYATDAGLP